MHAKTNITLRSAGPADAAALAALRFALRSGVALVWEPEEEFVARCTEWMRERLSAGGAWRCWIAEDKDEIVGNVWLQIFEKIPNPGEDAEFHGYVSNLYVAAPHRGSGLGSRLLAACLEVCEANVVDKLILWPTPQSRALYQRHGFDQRNDLFAREARIH